ncbi:MAG: peptidase [Bythopirellula sp.]
MTRYYSRRQFLNTAAAGSAAALAAPTIVTAKKTDGPTIVGVAGHQYEVQHMWPQLPEKYRWQTTHNVAFDSAGLLYVIHQGRGEEKPEHRETIFVFDDQGKFIRAFGAEFIGGGHGIEIRNEGGQDFLYVCAYQEQRSFAKLDTNGEMVWRQGAPMESGFYAAGEDQFPRDDSPWGRNRFLPTNIAFHPDGGFFLSDGYGAWRIHRYDQDAKWVSSFGKPADEQKSAGTFHLPHGIWIDSRGDEPLVVVADRVLARLQWFTLAGEHRRTQEGFILPANIDTYGELMLVPDLSARVTLLDQQNNVICHLGEGMTPAKKVKADRGKEATWVDGEFIHPHDACFDNDGNIYVAEWVARGRVTKLRRLS